MKIRNIKLRKIRKINPEASTHKGGLAGYEGKNQSGGRRNPTVYTEWRLRQTGKNCPNPKEGSVKDISNGRHGMEDLIKSISGTTRTLKPYLHLTGQEITTFPPLAGDWGFYSLENLNIRRGNTSSVLKTDFILSARSLREKIQRLFFGETKYS